MSAVVVRTSFTGNLFGPAVKYEHTPAGHWRVTKKGTLIVYDQGTEVARYKRDHWVAVSLEPEP